MKLVLLTAIFFFKSLLPAYGSIKVCIDHEKNEIQMIGQYRFYGDEATEGVAKACVEEINSSFNNKFLIQLNESGPFRRLVSKVSHKVISEEKARSFSLINVDPKFNLVRIDTPPKGSRIFISQHGLENNFGYFIKKNILGGSTTCAHEFGHGLGLEHPEKPCNWEGQGIPSLMAPRGCRVNAQYQYEPFMPPGQKGGSLNPKFRQVHHTEIAQINFGNLDFKFESPMRECATIGAARNKVFNKDGSIYTPFAIRPSM